MIELSPIYLKTKNQHKTIYFYVTPVIELSPIYLETKSEHKSIYFYVTPVIELSPIYLETNAAFTRMFNTYRKRM